MPVDLRVETDGKTEDKKIEVVEPIRRLASKRLEGRVALNWIPGTMSSPILPTSSCALPSCAGRRCSSRRSAGALSAVQQGSRSQQEQFAGPLSRRGDFLPAAQLSSLGEFVPLFHQRRWRPTLDGSLEPRTVGQDFRHHGPARASNQRISPSHSDQ